MSNKSKRGTFIHGIAASEHLDSSGERIKIDGVDISSLTKDGTFNYEHDSKSPSSIVGKIWEAKKILKRADCDNDSQKYFWDKIKMPFIYVAGELFDSVGHTSAGEVAAMLRYDQLDAMNKDAKKLINFSIEGTRVEKTGQIITKCIARKVSITLTPCNKVCEAEELKIDDGAKKESATGEFMFVQDVMSKADEPSCEIMKGEVSFLYQNTEVVKAEKKPHPRDPVANYDKLGPKQPSEAKQKEYVARVNAQMKKPMVKCKLGKYDSSVRKALTASCGMGSPSSKVNDLGKEEHEKGVHTRGRGNAGPGQSNAGTMAVAAHNGKTPMKPGGKQRQAVASRQMHTNKLHELKQMPKPNLPKSEFLYKNEAMPKEPSVKNSQPNQGGRIGQTKSGKDVFSNARIADYKGFSPQDHAEAADMHRQMVLKTPSFKDKEMHMNKIRLHNSAFSTSREKEIKMQGMGKAPGAIPSPQAMANVAAAKTAVPGAMPKPAMFSAIPQTSPKGVMGYSAFASNYAKPAAIPPTSNPAVASAPPVPKIPMAPPPMAAPVPNPNMKPKMAKSETFLIRKLGEADVTKASKNVREQRKKVFGTKSQPGAVMARQNKQAAPTPTELPLNVVRMKPKAAPAPEAAPQEQPPMKIAKSEKRKIMKMLGDQAFDAFEKKEELVAFLAEKLPKLSEKERLALAKAVAYTNEKKKEKALKSLLED